MSFEPCCLATAIGSLPHKDPQQAVRVVLREHSRRADLAAVAGQRP